MLRTELLDYHLPPELVATRPADRRDESRLMVVWRGEGGEPGRVEHRVFRDLPELLRAGDLLVFNTSAVLPARFLGFREDTGGKVEGLFLEVVEGSGEGEMLWLAMVKSRRFKPGARVVLRRRDNTVSTASLELVARSEEVEGAWVVRVHPGDELSCPDAGPAGCNPAPLHKALLERIGRPPLPPYIRAARRASGLADEAPEDVERYQTVYARGAGSVAAPTAGLHFTAELLGRLAARGVGRAEVTLHVGAGTFRTVEAETVEGHDMHAELCAMSGEAVEAVRRTRGAGGRVIAVGSTSMRTMESYARWGDSHRRDAYATGHGAGLWTDLLLTPGAELLWTDGLLTNFHLPRSTLMALVATLLDRDPERAAARLRSLYEEAVDRRYRFYSYGDAMLILP